MGEQQHGGLVAQGEASQKADELASMDPVVLVSAEQVA
jgi:hypothetical protein